MTLDELKQLEDQLWAAADSLRANTDLKPNEYSTPVLGLIFLKFADNKYSAFEAAIIQEFNQLQGTRRAKTVAEIAIKHCGFYLPDNARYNGLLELAETENLAKKIKEAMQAIEDHKNEDDFKNVLPKDESPPLIVCHKVKTLYAVWYAVFLISLPMPLVKTNSAKPKSNK